MASTGVVAQYQDGWSVVQSQLAEGAALIETLQALIGRLGARVHSGSGVLDSPYSKELGERTVRVSVVRVFCQKIRQLVACEGSLHRRRSRACRGVGWHNGVRCSNIGCAGARWGSSINSRNASRL